MTNAKKIAIDVVILPPEDIMDKIININERGGGWGIMLGKDDFLPHLSLAMGCVEFDQLEAVKDATENIVKNFSPISLEFGKLRFEKDQMGLKNYSYLVTEDNIEIKRLHEALMDGLRLYLHYDCAKESLYYKEGEEVSDPEYINNYLSRYSHNFFYPHITIRTKEIPKNDILPIKFMATTVAICHVGVGTTCRKVLFSTELKKRP